MDLLEKILPVITPALSEDIVVDRSPELARGAASYCPAAMLLGHVVRRIRVTPQDVAQGVKGEGASCAIARAWKWQYPEDTVDISGEKPKVNGCTIDMPPFLVTWVGRFDRGELDGTQDTLELVIYGM